MDGPSVAGGQARQPPTSAYSASDPSRLVSSDVALCPTGKDNDGFNEGPLNHVMVDLANKKKKTATPTARWWCTQTPNCAPLPRFWFSLLMRAGIKCTFRCYGLQPPQESKVSLRNLKSLYKAWPAMWHRKRASLPRYWLLGAGRLQFIVVWVKSWMLCSRELTTKRTVRWLRTWMWR